MLKINHYLKIELPDNLSETTVERLRQDVENYIESTILYYITDNEYLPIKVKTIIFGSN